ncbi:hypothetical protein [Hymenobacter metallicola]|uniref:STAS/SEC14 domain-containing protein n=1 Tax=Hymenobacter metallicola TaxID=2563114 RepID=A0A4Z0QFP4_9BACT|nr:hypothetical protein [Hymenobacter metallicola]TGE28857.1 hypothetical protein E5K02_05180 [Hymenobacter metallicola]
MTGPTFTLATSSQDAYCAAQYEPENEWIRITWRGFVINDDGVQGATAYLGMLQAVPCAMLLNDNSGVTGPWFDSVDWLQHIWAPQVKALGLRYVAHVLPANDFPSVLPPADAFAGQFELQIFSTLAEAEQWLASCRRAQASDQVA